jgi:hypothetical protein
MTANRDPRLGQAYERYFRQWEAGGGQLFMHFSDVGAESKYGSWGALESIMQITTPLSDAPSKWQAIQNFIAGVPCLVARMFGRGRFGASAAGPDESSHSMTVATMFTVIAARILKVKVFALLQSESSGAACAQNGPARPASRVLKPPPRHYFASIFW